MTVGVRSTDVTEKVRREACSTLANAFAADPWARHVLGISGSCRPRALARLMSVPVAVAVRRGGLVLETTPDAGGRPVAVSTWVPADRRGVGFLTAVLTGALTLPLEIGPATMIRLARDETALDRALAFHLRPDDAYLWALGVERHRHGRGLGRIVVDRTCLQAAGRGFRRVVLNTDNPSNVAVYQRLGFDLLGEHLRPSGLTSHVLGRALS